MDISSSILDGNLLNFFSIICRPIEVYEYDEVLGVKVKNLSLVKITDVRQEYFTNDSTFNFIYLLFLTK